MTSALASIRSSGVYSIVRRRYRRHGVSAARGICRCKIRRHSGAEHGYLESGNAAGFPVILLHGFPDDVHAWDDVTPALVKAGHRVLTPYLRGFGPTRFRDAASLRMAEQAAIGQDVVDFADVSNCSASRWWVSIGRKSSVHRRRSSRATGPRCRFDRRLFDSEHDHACAAFFARGRARDLVSDYLQYGARQSWTSNESSSALPVPLGDLVPHLAFH